MSKKSPIPGKTPWQAARAEQAVDRKILRENRTTAEQLELLDQRPGKSAKERARLS